MSDAAAGFSIHPGVLVETETEALLRALAVVGRTRAGARHLMAHPAVAAVATDARLLGLAQAVLGPAAVPYRATLFDKSPGSNWLVVWHQDTALPLKSRAACHGWGPWSRKGGVLYAHAPASALERVVALRLHLDASTVDNGPLRVIPGTHLMGVLQDVAIQELSRRLASVECLVGVGGVVRMRPLLLHASSKAVAPLHRRVLHIEYADAVHLEPELELAVA